MPKEVDIKGLTIEDELRLFEVFADSPAWSVIKQKWAPIVQSAIGGALSGRATDRSFLAGKANGLKYFLEYPEKHIRELRSRIKSGGAAPTLRKDSFESEI